LSAQARIDFAGKKVYSSALLYYGSQNEVESFSEAAINRASRDLGQAMADTWSRGRSTAASYHPKRSV
jgi:hypothetical protein